MSLFGKLFGGPAKPIEFANLDACSICQLDCRGCRMRKRDHGGRGRGYLSFENFKKFLALNPAIRHVELANGGEIFLNPDLVKIIGHADGKGVALSIGGGANFNSVSDEQIDALVRHRLRSLCVALDGGTPESYAWYRRGGDFNRVIANVKRLNGRKWAAGAQYPKLTWQYIILPSNRRIAEIRRAKEMARELGMEMSFVRDWDNFVPSNREEVESETGLNYSEEKGETIANDRFVPCAQLWRQPQINWDGRFFGCCMNIEKDFGANMFEIPIDEFMRSKIMRESRRMLSGGGKCSASPCAECEYFKWRRRIGEFVSEKEMRAWRV